MKNLSSTAVRAAALIVAVVAAATVASAQTNEMEQKRQAEIGIQPGASLSAANAQLATGLLPPEILEFYKKDEWKNPVVDWPLGKMIHEKEFDEGTKANADKLDVDANGGIIDKTTKKQPPTIIGFPFPKIDPKDPNAGVKTIWNFNYSYYNVGNSRNFVDLVWVSRSGIDRVSGQEVFFLYYDGQKAKYQPKNNPNNLLVQFIATATSPQDLYGTTALGWRFRDSGKRDNNWAYVPALRRIRAVSPANRSDGFLGSDMSQDDGPFFDGKPEDFTWKLVGETEMLRIVDAASLTGDTKRVELPEGGWRTPLSPKPIAGFEDPNWKGSPWAPVGMALAKRKFWIIEAVPKDKYYLYGKIELYIDQETFQGAYLRKYSWSGELLNDYLVTGLINSESKAPDDGASEWFWGTASVYQASLNLKNDRATVTGFPLKDRGNAVNDRRVPYDPSFFDYQTLYRFGK